MAATDPSGDREQRHVVVFDLASLQLRREQRRIDVVTADGQLLVSATVPTGLSRRAAVHHALEQALGARVARAVGAAADSRLVSAHVGLYNPHTGLVALPDGTVAGSGSPVAVDDRGTTAVWDDLGLLLEPAAPVSPAVRLPVRDEGSRSVSREVAAHREPITA